jgi:hypothetical protein
MAARFRRLLAARRRTRRQLVAEHADRAGRWMVTIVAAARSMGATVPTEIDASLVVFRTWALYLARWAEEQGQ